jgi:hypothetical protein
MYIASSPIFKLCQAQTLELPRIEMAFLSAGIFDADIHDKIIS